MSLGQARPGERYTLTLTHEYIHPDGEKQRLEPPVAVTYSLNPYTACVYPPPKSVVVNDMLERLSRFILDSLSSKEGGRS